MNDHDHVNEARDENRKPEMVTVTCSHKQGLVLRLHQTHHHKVMADMKVPDARRDSVTLKSGGNQVDKDFMKSWLDENPDSDLVASGAIAIAEPAKAAEPDEDETSTE